jgi:hypothetical protein
MTDGQTHYDPVEANAVCHPECAIAEIKRLRDWITQQERELDLRVNVPSVPRPTLRNCKEQ